LKEAALAAGLALLLSACALLLLGFNPWQDMLGVGVGFIDWSGHRWAHWHLSRSLMGEEGFFFSSMLNHPDGMYTLLFQGNFLFALLGGVLNLVVSLDHACALMVVMMLAGNGLGAYLMVRVFTGRRAPAALLGFLAAFCTHTAWAVDTGNLEYGFWLWICLFLISYIRLLQQGRLRDGALTGLLAGVAALSNLPDTFHLGLLGALLLAFHARALDRRKALGLLLALAVALVVVAPVGWAYHQASGRVHLDASLIGREGGPGPGAAPPPPTDNPSAAHAPAARRSPGLPMPDGTRVLLSHSADRTMPLLLAALALLGLVTAPRRALPWAFAALLFFVLSLGRNITGSDPALTGAPGHAFMPFALLVDHLPGYSRMQYPGRLFAYTVLCLLVVAGMGASWVAERARPQHRWYLAGALTLLALLQPLLTWRVIIQPRPKLSPFYQRLAADQDRYALITLPFNFLDLETSNLYYQPTHGKPLFNVPAAPYVAQDPSNGKVRGNALLSRVATLQHELLSRQGIMELHAAHYLPGPGDPRPDDAQLQQARVKLVEGGFRYMVVHLRQIGIQGVATVRADGPLVTFLRQQLGEPAHRDAGLLAFDLRAK